MLKNGFWLILSTILIAGCSLVAPTGDTSSDAQAAQNFLPQITGYNTTDADTIVDALSSVAGGSSLLSGNVVMAGVVAKIDDMIQCLQNVGAVTARIYTQATLDITNLNVPAAGVVAIINQDRLRDNFLACALGAGPQNGPSAQAATIQPCAGSGDFKVGGQTLTYLYAATAQPLCDIFQQHFDSIIANNP